MAEASEKLSLLDLADAATPKTYIERKLEKARARHAARNTPKDDEDDEGKRLMPSRLSENPIVSIQRAARRCAGTI